MLTHQHEGCASPPRSARLGRMQEQFRPNTGPVVFLSDAHLGAPIGRAERGAWLVRFLESFRGKIGGLFVVGDLFDFWFEYRHAIPKAHFQICRALADIIRSGVPAIYFGGNHDFWAGSYLKNEIGLVVADEPQTMEIQGRTIFVAHGDGLGKGDLGYRVLKRILRNKLCIGLYRWIHPDLGVPLAYRVSALSRRKTLDRSIWLPRLIDTVASPKLADRHDSVVIGHIHEPEHLRLPGGDFLILGDWIDHFTYAVLEDGKFTLRRYVPAGDDEVIAVEEVADGESIAGK